MLEDDQPETEEVRDHCSAGRSRHSRRSPMAAYILEVSLCASPGKGGYIDDDSFLCLQGRVCDKAHVLTFLCSLWDEEERFTSRVRDTKIIMWSRGGAAQPE